jgi:hypothetical protein
MEPLSALEAAIRHLLAVRDAKRAGATICPSDAARLVGGDDWREWMDAAREAARRLVARGEIVVTQRGQVVDLASARGPIRLRLVRRPRPPPRQG